MKPTTLIFAVMLLFSACQRGLPTTSPTTDNDTTLQVFVPVLPFDNGLKADSSMQAELDYYLERHNVQDEGYEMVAAYSERRDTMLALLPEAPATLLNVGHWEGIEREGTVVGCDTAGHILIGTYARDTLSSGFRLDSISLYAGQFVDGMADGISPDINGRTWIRL